MATENDAATTRTRKHSKDSQISTEDGELDRTVIEAEVLDRTEVKGIDKMKLIELRERLKELHLSTTGKKSELQDRLRRYMEEEDDETEDEEDDEAEVKEAESEEESEEDIESEIKMKKHRRDAVMKKSMFTIKDVEESLSYFTGDDKLSVRKWIEEFEGTGALLQWNDLQMFIYGKRMLKGSAKQFVTAQKGITSWTILRKRLKKEFKTVVNSAQIHEQLSKRQRKPKETGRQYVYAMMEIASEGNVEEKALMEHIINGIPDREYNKMILYQASTLEQLKANLDVYDRIKEKLQYTPHTKR